ncbi:MAG: isoprenyl transferase [Nitratireductor sp.]|nr:isoprenyl transferase [Nitratireductor sp.]
MADGAAMPGNPQLRHLAIIMDGNGRWASQRGLPRHHGHRKGVEAVRTIVRAAREQGIGYLTLYSFSTENWSRPREEIAELFKLLRFFIRRDLAELHQANVRIRVIGERERLPADIVNLLAEAESLTANNTAQTLVVAFNYGSRQEIAAAARRIAEKVARGEIAAAAIDETTIGDHLFTAGIPDPDVILRTAGEKRLSNFLLWQAAYSEFVFVDKFWPEITADDLTAVVREFGNRERRFGGLGEETPDGKALGG